MEHMAVIMEPNFSQLPTNCKVSVEEVSVEEVLNDALFVSKEGTEEYRTAIECFCVFHAPYLKTIRMPIVPRGSVLYFPELFWYSIRSWKRITIE